MDSRTQTSPRNGRLRLPVLLGVATLCALAAPAQAQYCRNNAPYTVPFGTVNTDAPTDTLFNVPYTCTANSQRVYVRACFYLQGGQPPRDGINPRAMTRNPYAALDMAYNLYSDPARTQVLGPEGSPYTVLSGMGEVPPNTTLTFNLPIYGRVFPGQTALQAGNYQWYVPGTIRYALGTAGYPASCVDPAFPDRTFNTTLYPTAAVTTACRVTAATDLNFPNAGNLVTELRAVSTITVRCPASSTYHVALGNGLHGPSRRMSNGTSFVAYELYRDPDRKLRWGSTPNTDTVDGPGGGEGTPVPLTVYGLVPPQGYVPAGRYSDTIVVTLTL